MFQLSGFCCICFTHLRQILKPAQFPEDFMRARRAKVLRRLGAPWTTRRLHLKVAPPPCSQVLHRDDLYICLCMFVSTRVHVQLATTYQYVHMYVCVFVHTHNFVYVCCVVLCVRVCAPDWQPSINETVS